MAAGNEMLDTLKDVIARLTELGVDYYVTGSVAMSAYATARTTLDIDMVVQIDPSDAGLFEEKFRGAYYITLQSIQRAQNHSSMFNVLNNETGVKVDFIIKKPGKIEAGKFERRRPTRVGDVEFWVISRDDLILSKLAWAKDSLSEMQFRDIRSLVESGANLAVLTTAISEQGLDQVWDAFNEWKIRIKR